MSWYLSGASLQVLNDSLKRVNNESLTANARPCDVKDPAR